MNVIAKPLFRLDMLKAHQEYRNAKGEKLPGVTTVIGLLDKPALLRWAWKLGREGIDIDKARDSAATVGTIAHARIEAYLRGMELDETGIGLEVLDKSANAFLRFLDWWQGGEFTVEETERQMVSEAMQVGGTADIIATRPNGRRLLIDVKTSSGIYREMRLQVAAYGALYDEEEARTDEVFTRAGAPGSPKKIDECWIVRVGKNADDDEIEPVEIRNRAVCVEAFHHLAQAWWALKTIR